MVDEYEQRISTPEQTTPTPETTTSTPVESNDFPKVTELISQEGLEEKRELINKVLSDNKIKEGFENFLKTTNPRIKLKIKKDLLNCKTEDEVKSIIVENLPGYKIGEENNGENGDLGVEVTTKQEKEGQAEEHEKNEEAQKRRKEALNQRIELSKKDTELINKTKKDSEGYNNIKTQLATSGVLNQLSQNGFDEQFIDDYITIQATLQEIKNNPTYTKEEISTFDKIVKNLNNSCNIPDTNLSSFSAENISQTRTELFHSEVGNDSLIQAKKSNMDSEFHAKTYAEMFPEMGDDDMIRKYGKFLGGELKGFFDQYQNDPEIKDKFAEFKKNTNLVDNDGRLLQYNKIKDNPNIPDKDKELLENYDRMRSEINKIKEDTDAKTKDMMEDLCIISQIKGMYMCIGKGDNFNLNKAKEIQSKNGILTLNGHIDGVGFAIRQDTNNPKARLQTSQKLAKFNDGNSFSIGGSDNFVDSNFILPSQNEIFTSIAGAVRLDSDTSIENSENLYDYIDNLQTSIMGNVEKIYKDAEYVHHYMEGQVRGEKIIDDTLLLIDKISPSLADNEILMNNINQASNKDLYDFVKILKFNIDNSTNTEKDNLNQCITKILEITNNYKNTNGIESVHSYKYPPIIENYLKDKAWLNGGNEDSRLKMLSDLFKYYSENSRDTRSSSEGSDGQHSKMIINDLYRDLFESSSGATEIAINWEIQKKNEEKKKENENLELTEKDSEALDSILDLDNSDVWLA